MDVGLPIAIGIAFQMLVGEGLGDSKQPRTKVTWLLRDLTS